MSLPFNLLFYFFSPKKLCLKFTTCIIFSLGGVLSQSFPHPPCCGRGFLPLINLALLAKTVGMKILLSSETRTEIAFVFRVDSLQQNHTHRHTHTPGACPQAGQCESDGISTPLLVQKSTGGLLETDIWLLLFPVFIGGHFSNSSSQRIDNILPELLCYCGKVDTKDQGNSNSCLTRKKNFHLYNFSEQSILF